MSAHIDVFGSRSTYTIADIVRAKSPLFHPTKDVGFAQGSPGTAPARSTCGRPGSTAPQDR
ncbi:MAG: hypothetical protein ABWX74_14600 [Aeromicrobium sp.]